MSTETTAIGGGRVLVHADAEAVARAGAERFAEAAARAVEARGVFHAALTGGSGPRGLYRRLGEDPLRARIPWDRVHLWWGDERCVPPKHPRSNFGMADSLFIARVPIPPAHVHRMRGETGAARGAAAYADELREVMGAGVPRFDLVHLGVGPDGHVASLFPFAATLRARERIVAPALHRTGEWRITLTLPVLNAARAIDMIVLSGAKADVVRAAVRGPLDPYRLPVQLVRPKEGVQAWLLDADAARGLRG